MNDGRSLRGNVDRNPMTRSSFRSIACRSLRGNVDRNMCGVNLAFRAEGRSLRGNVDRNHFDVNERDIAKVVPYVGTWIEI